MPDSEEPLQIETEVLARLRVSGFARKRRRLTDEQPQERKKVDREPHAVGEIARSYLEGRGWAKQVSVAEVLARWPELVGENVAEHCRCEDFGGGVLRVQADSTSWATQLRLLVPQLLTTLAENLGEGVVDQVVVRGPRSPRWTHGSRSVPGRGPRDTYG